METKVAITITHITYLEEADNTVQFMTVAGKLTTKLIKDSMQAGNIYIKHEYEKTAFTVPTLKLYNFLQDNQ